MTLAPSAEVSRELLDQIDALQVDYLRSLDRKQLEAWVDCFAAEASYICIARENEDQGLPIAVMMDDCRERLNDRVKFINEVWQGTFEDYATRHFVQRTHAAAAGPSIYEVRSNFLVAYTNEGGRTEILAAGEYKDIVLLENGRAKFSEKRAILDTTVSPRYLVYPI